MRPSSLWYTSIATGAIQGIIPVPAPPAVCQSVSKTCAGLSRSPRRRRGGPDPCAAALVACRAEADSSKRLCVCYALSGREQRACALTASWARVSILVGLGPRCQRKKNPREGRGKVGLLGPGGSSGRMLTLSRRLPCKGAREREAALAGRAGRAVLGELGRAQPPLEHRIEAIFTIFTRCGLPLSRMGRQGGTSRALKGDRTMPSLRQASKDAPAGRNL